MLFDLDIEVIFLLLLVPLLGFLLSLYFIFRPASKKEKKNSQQTQIKQESKRSCPLCHHDLKKGEQVHSHIFPGKPDRIMHIFGCPYCYQKEDAWQRRCPRCNQFLKAEDHVIARFFEKSGRSHVHILGCPDCRQRK